MYEFEKYICTADTLKNTLTNYGVAIIPSVLDENECDQMAQGMWDTLETWTSDWSLPITKENPDSWKQIRDLFPKHSMLIQQYGLGHAQFIWSLRQNPKCAEIFAKFWECDAKDLLVSFDAASFHMPSEVTKIGWHRQTWHHSDQSYLRNDFECMQSWVTAFDVNEGDATLSLLEGSHKFHKEFAEKFGIKEKDNWYKLGLQTEIDFYKEKGCNEVCIKCPKGTIVFWDSRTIHCGVEPRKGRAAQNFRCVAYLCYMPRSLATKKDIQKKIKAFEEMRMTTHWPCKVKLFPKMPRTYGAEIKPVANLLPPVISELGRRLAGYEL